jgi:hypothetical protein
MTPSRPEPVSTGRQQILASLMHQVHEMENAGRVGPTFEKSSYNTDLYPVHVVGDSRRDSDLAPRDIASEVEAREQDRLACVKEAHRREGGGDQFIDDEGDEAESEEEEVHSGSDDGLTDVQI